MEAHFNFKHKILQFFVVLLSFFATVSFQNVSIAGNQAWASSTESYLQRPDILSINPKKNSSLGQEWNDLKAAHFSFVAQILALYPEEFDLYFLARDSELLYDTAKLVTLGTSDEKRIHLLNVSRANMRDPLLVEYLEQNGISEKNLAKGKKFLFIDTGFAGTIPRVILENFEQKYHDNFKTHLVVSSNPSHPSSRSFLYYLNPLVLQQLPASMHGTIISYEHMPRFTYRSNYYQKINGKIHPMSDLSTSDQDGSVSKEKSLAYMQDLKATWQDTKVQKRYQQEFDHNKALLHLMMDGTQKSAEILNQLFIDESEGSKRSRGLVLDLLDANKNLGYNLKTPIPQIRQLFTTSDGNNEFHSKKNLLIENQPHLAPYLEDPETHLPKLIQQKKWSVLGVLIDADVDTEINKLLTRYIFANPASGQLRSLQSILIAKDNYIINEEIISSLKQYKTSDLNKMLDVMIEMASVANQNSAAPNLRNILADVLEKMSPEFARKYVEFVIDNFKFKGRYGVHADIANIYFSKSVSYANEDLLIKIVNYKDKDLINEILQNVFRQKESIQLKKTLRLITELSKKDLFYVMLRVFEEHISADFLEELKFAVEHHIQLNQDYLHHVRNKYNYGPFREKFEILFQAAGMNSLIKRQKFILENWETKVAANSAKKIAKAQSNKEITKTQSHKVSQEPVGISENLEVGQFVLIGKKKYKILSIGGEGRRGIVFKVSDSSQQAFALKVAKSNEIDNLNSIQNESKKSEDWKKAGIEHSKVIFQGDHFVLKSWVDGISGEDVVKSYDSGNKKFEKAIQAIQNMILQLANQGTYVGDFRPPNLIWTGQKWILVDSGSIKSGLSAAEALQKWQATDIKGEKIKRRWGDGVSNLLKCSQVISE